MKYNDFILFSEIQKTVKKNFPKIIIVFFLGGLIANIYFFKFFFNQSIQSITNISWNTKKIPDTFKFNFWDESKEFLVQENNIVIEEVDFDSLIVVFKDNNSEYKYSIILKENRLIIRNNEQIDFSYLISKKKFDKKKFEHISDANFYMDNYFKKFNQFLKKKYNLKIDRSLINILRNTELVTKSLFPIPSDSAMDLITLETFKKITDEVDVYTNFLETIKNFDEFIYSKTIISKNILHTSPYPVLILLLINIAFIVFFISLYIILLIVRANKRT